jgi:lipoprotein-releasing system permease protein
MTSPSWTAPYRLMVALRLLRARKVNLISIVGVMLGVASIIVVLSVMDGFQRQLRAMIRGTLSDMIVEIDPERVGSYAEIKRAVEAVDGVEAVTLQKHAYAVAPADTRDIDGARQSYLPVRIVGIVPEDERRVSDFFEYLESFPGQPEDDPFEIETDDFVPEEMPRVVLSEWLAKRLSDTRIPLDVGDRVVLLTIERVAGNGAAKYATPSREAVISRIYKSGNSEYDKLHVYADLRRAEVFFPPDQAAVLAELRVKLDDYGRAEELREDIARAIGPYDSGVAVFPHSRIQTWEERQHNLLLAVNNEKFILGFVLFFIVLVACFTIFATLTMTVAEKTRDIGVLLALGGTPRGILSIFMLNGTLVGTLGAGLGYGLGLVVARNVNGIREFLKARFGWDIFPSDIYLFDEIPSYIDHPVALMFAVSAAFAALVFAIIPSVRAARLRPVRALRYE